MNFLDYIALIRRHWIMGLIITAIVTVSAGTLVSLKNNQPFETTIFLSIGNKEGQNSSSQTIYDDVQAADAFSQTVQGWFKNPEFIQQINVNSGLTTDINSRQQEKQNVLITYSTISENQANIYEKTIKDQLSNEIATYNSKTNDQFTLALFEANTQKKPLSIPLFLLIGLLGGLTVASIGLYGFEYLFQKISSISQIDEILDKKVLDKFRNNHPDEQKLSYLSAYIDKIEGKNIQLIGLGSDAGQISKTLGLMNKNKTIESINFPLESKKISKDNNIAVCTFGKTTTEDLYKLKTLISNSFDLIIVES